MMRAISEFIIVPLNGEISNHKSESGFVLSSSVGDHRNSTRIGVVKSVPLNYNGPIKDGDHVIVHHNVFRKYNDIKGREKHSSSLIRGTYYTADIIEIFAFKSTEDWVGVYPYIFFSSEGGSFGEILISSPESSANGFEKGSKFYYKPGSEYEFTIEGVKMYRIPEQNICLKTN